MISVLPPMEHTFTLSAFKGTDTGQIFEGTFVYKRPNMKTKSDISKTVAILNGGIQGLDSDAESLHVILATLKHTIISAPEWWTKADSGFQLYDLNVIFHIFAECQKFEREWHAKVWGDPAKEESKDESKV